MRAKNTKMLEKEINGVLKLMETTPKNSAEYKELVETLKQLKDMEEHPEKWSKNTILLVTANLVGIGAILVYEKKDIITSKALAFVMKGRV